jgi:hypothetical protein
MGAMTMPESGVNHRSRQVSPQAGHVAVGVGCVASKRAAHALHRSITGPATPTFACFGV